MVIDSAGAVSIGSRAVASASPSLHIRNTTGTVTDEILGIRTDAIPGGTNLPALRAFAGGGMVLGYTGNMSAVQTAARLRNCNKINVAS